MQFSLYGFSLSLALRGGVENASAMSLFKKKKLFFWGEWPISGGESPPPKQPPGNPGSSKVVNHSHSHRHTRIIIYIYNDYTN